jgi:sn-1 stearoyl-lipid 9-desaturase
MTAYSEPLPQPKIRWYVVITTILQYLAVGLAFLPQYFSWSAVGVAALLHFVTMGLGISLGFHRLASHRSLTLPKWLEYFFIFCGTLAGQGSVKGWVGYHRMHHLHTDKTDDPHNSQLGFWWSHIGWFMCEIPNEPERYRLTRDIANDPFYSFCHKYHNHLHVVLALALYALGGMPFVVWGMFVRLFIGHQATFFVNSACHLVGYRTHDTSDSSTNCWWVAALTFGEGWHNNHHAAQSSARFGWQWWEIDVVWWTIQLLSKLGLATKVKTANFALREANLNAD